MAQIARLMNEVSGRDGALRDASAAFTAAQTEWESLKATASQKYDKDLGDLRAEADKAVDQANADLEQVKAEARRVVSEKDQTIRDLYDQQVHRLVEASDARDKHDDELFEKDETIERLEAELKALKESRSATTLPITPPEDHMGAAASSHPPDSDPDSDMEPSTGLSSPSKQPKQAKDSGRRNAKQSRYERTHTGPTHTRRIGGIRHVRDRLATANPPAASGHTSLAAIIRKMKNLRASSVERSSRSRAEPSESHQVSVPVEAIGSDAVLMDGLPEHERQEGRLAFEYREDRFLTASLDFKGGDWSKVPLDEALWRGDGTTMAYYASRPSGKPIRTQVRHWQLQPGAPGSQLYPMTSEEDLQGETGNEYLRRCIFTQLPELQVEAAEGILEPEVFSRFCERSLGEVRVLACCEKVRYPDTWRAALDHLRRNGHFGMACQFWAAGVSTLDSSSQGCWPPMLFEGLRVFTACTR